MVAERFWYEDTFSVNTVRFDGFVCCDNSIPKIETTGCLVVEGMFFYPQKRCKFGEYKKGGSPRSRDACIFVDIDMAYDYYDKIKCYFKEGVSVNSLFSLESEVLDSMGCKCLIDCHGCRLVDDAVVSEKVDGLLNIKLKLVVKNKPVRYSEVHIKRFKE